MPAIVTSLRRARRIVNARTGPDKRRAWREHRRAAKQYLATHALDSDDDERYIQRSIKPRLTGWDIC